MYYHSSRLMILLLWCFNFGLYCHMPYIHWDYCIYRCCACVVCHFLLQWPLSGGVNSRLAKRPLVFNGRLANRGLSFLVKEATGIIVIIIAFIMINIIIMKIINIIMVIIITIVIIVRLPFISRVLFLLHSLLFIHSLALCQYCYHYTRYYHYCYHHYHCCYFAHFERTYIKCRWMDE